ncbi:hypothetical protein GBK02_11540 [Dechloromonas sp. TW-R-39-2]|uniref:hypothetical protein n=1 Tax=Dechloromonas sp. TW-R-39-2 TaxID=2654218 RepID=UPI00193E08FB|nr:hypothetical protein [Dechloromonas sp. TW-R-39-2]QRM19988.1 hypothetical protein GBK02_11540 [Dechloromonas sp. TW-R-39-2]
MLIQAVDRKRCASCERWQGPRQPGATNASVLIESETVTGLCHGGGWDGDERRARSACGHWQRWLKLQNSPEIPENP